LEIMKHVALSYCWGKDTSHIVATTKTNLQSYQHAVRVVDLPRTVQDAIQVCAGLGASYIWVDALCIIQDDPDDWAREAATIVDVYANLLITISARDPDSCDKGYLGPQKFGSPDWQYAIPMEVPPSIATRPRE